MAGARHLLEGRRGKTLATPGNAFGNPLAIRSDVGAQPTESEEVLSTALGGDWEFRGIRPPKR